MTQRNQFWVEGKHGSIQHSASAFSKISPATKPDVFAVNPSRKTFYRNKDFWLTPAAWDDHG